MSLKLLIYVQKPQRQQFQVEANSGGKIPKNVIETIYFDCYDDTHYNALIIQVSLKIDSSVFICLHSKMSNVQLVIQKLTKAIVQTHNKHFLKSARQTVWHAQKMPVIRVFFFVGT